jgi:hypothetical protein
MFRSYSHLAILAGCALVAGCGGTQSRLAFIPRHAATVVPFVPTPNVSGDHEQSLEATLGRSLREQEHQDERADLVAPAPPPDERSSSDEGPASAEPSDERAPGFPARAIGSDEPFDDLGP